MISTISSIAPTRCGLCQNRTRRLRRKRSNVLHTFLPAPATSANLGSVKVGAGHVLEEIATPDDEGVALLRQASDALHLSARGFHRTLRVARTLADLDGAERVGRVHIAEALSYRGETLRQSRAA